VIVSVFETSMFYAKDAVEACRQVLNDVVYCLKDYEAKFYLIGGWAVYYLLDQPGRTPEEIGYAGTEDVDLAFLVPMSELDQIMARLEQAGYRKSASQRMDRVVSERRVIVDFLGGNQEIKDNLTLRRRISGETLSGEIMNAEISVANLPACLVLKGKAFDSDPKDKDAYDIYYLVTYGGAMAGEASQEVRKSIKYPLVKEGMKDLHVHFGRLEGRGLRAATQTLSRLEGKTTAESRALVRGSFRRFFVGIGMPVNF